MDSVWYYDFPIGKVCISANETHITAITIGNVEGILCETTLIKRASKELYEYFDGKRSEFDLPIKLSGTEFQKSVWRELCKIPYGETRSYKDIAAAIDNPKASRAVGMANNRNKIIIVIPCHRVIGANGSLVGYGGGVDIKEKLLNLEKDTKI